MKLLLAALLGVVFFAVGLVATFMAMPTLAPDMVDETRARLDSLAAAASAEPGAAPMFAAGDSLAMAFTDSTAGVASAALEPLNALVSTLRDSLKIVHDQLVVGQETQRLLQERVDEMETHWATLQANYDEARQMSGTIVKLEDGELGELLGQLEMDVVEAMYLEATARNRARLLQMLPSEKAAFLVNKLASPQETPADTPPLRSDARNQ